jgi:hypothetical protein
MTLPITSLFTPVERDLIRHECDIKARSNDFALLDELGNKTIEGIDQYGEYNALHTRRWD